MKPQDLQSIVLACISSSVCLAGFAGVIIINIVNFKNRSRESERAARIANKFAEKANKPLPAKTRKLLGIYLFFSLIGLGSVASVFLVVISYKVSLPLFADVNSFGLIGSLLLLVAIIVTLILRILYRIIFKSD